MSCFNNIPIENEDRSELKIYGVIQSHLHGNTPRRRSLNYSLEVCGDYDHIKGMEVLVERIEEEVKLIRKYIEELKS